MASPRDGLIGAARWIEGLRLDCSFDCVHSALNWIDRIETEIGRNIDEFLRSLDALQKSDSEGVATPADWPENDRFGDRVLLPPPGTSEAVAAREAEAGADGSEQYDWWFTLAEQYVRSSSLHRGPEQLFSRTFFIAASRDWCLSNERLVWRQDDQTQTGHSIALEYSRAALWNRILRPRVALRGRGRDRDCDGFP